MIWILILIIIILCVLIPKIETFIDYKKKIRNQENKEFIKPNEEKLLELYKYLLLQDNLKKHKLTEKKYKTMREDNIKRFNKNEDMRIKSICEREKGIYKKMSQNYKDDVDRTNRKRDHIKKMCPKKDYKIIPKCPKTTIECGNQIGYCFDPSYNLEKQDHLQGRMISTYYEPQLDGCAEDRAFDGDMPDKMDGTRIWTRFGGRYYSKCDYLKLIEPKEKIVNTVPWFPDFQWRNPNIGFYGKNNIWKNLIDLLKDRPKLSSNILVIINKTIKNKPIKFVGVKIKEDQIKIYPLKNYGIIKSDEFIIIDLKGNLIRTNK
jgi:hypothetical protein